MDQLRQQQQQREQHPQAQTGLASAPAASLATEEVAHTHHDSRPEQASSSQQAAQQPDVADLCNPQREVDQPGSAANDAAVWTTTPAELPAAAASQGARADSHGGGTISQGGGVDRRGAGPERGLTGGRQQTPLEGAAPVIGAMIPPGTAQQTALPAEPCPRLHSSAASLTAEAPTSEQYTGPGASAEMPEDQPAHAAVQVAAPGQQQASSLHQAMAEEVQEAHTTLMPQQQADLPKELGVNHQQQGGVSPQQQAVALELLEGGPRQTGGHEHADAAPLATDTAAAVAADRQAVRPLQEPAVRVRLPQQAVAPLQQPALPVEQPLALVPQQGQAAAALNDEPMAFEELVGLRGPIRLLFENAGTVIFSSAVFMAAALWAPFMWGRITIRGIATAQTAWKLTVLPAAAMQLLLKNYQVCFFCQEQGDLVTRSGFLFYQVCFVFFFWAA